MARLVLLLLLLGALVILVFQNMAPVGLVIVGVSLPALPLALWVIGAIAAGALTTVILSALIGQGRRSAPKRSNRPRRQGDRPTAPTGTPWTPPAWTRPTATADPAANPAANPVTAAPSDSTRAQRAAPSRDRSPDDDWDVRPIDDWDDWAAAKPTSTASAQSSAANSPRDDANTPEWRYQPPTYPSPFGTPAYEDPTLKDREVWDEWAEEETLIDVAYEEPGQSESSAASNVAEEALPPRKIVEIQRSPESQDQSGTVYSFSYRRDQLSVDDTRPSASTPASSSTDSDQPEPASPDKPQIDDASQTSPPTPPTKEPPIRIIIPPYTTPRPSSPAVDTSPTVLQPTPPDQLPSGLSNASVDEPDEDELGFGDSPFQLGDDVDAFESHPDGDGGMLEEGDWLNDEPVSANASVSRDGDKEVWDDWDDDWDDDDEADNNDPHPPGQGNPPLRL